MANENQSPWAHRAEEFKQAAQHCRAIRDEIGGAVRDLQQESYELYELQDRQSRKDSHNRDGHE